MNVRIENQNARFKITQNELSALLNGDNISLNLSHMIVVTIKPNGKCSNMKLQHVVDNRVTNLSLIISREKLTALADMGKSREGISSEQNGLLISLQVDIRKNPAHEKSRSC